MWTLKRFWLVDGQMRPIATGLLPVGSKVWGVGYSGYSKCKSDGHVVFNPSDYPEEFEIWLFIAKTEAMNKYLEEVGKEGREKLLSMMYYENMPYAKNQEVVIL